MKSLRGEKSACSEAYTTVTLSICQSYMTLNNLFVSLNISSFMYKIAIVSFTLNSFLRIKWDNCYFPNYYFLFFLVYEN